MQNEISNTEARLLLHDKDRITRYAMRMCIEDNIYDRSYFKRLKIYIEQLRPLLLAKILLDEHPENARKALRELEEKLNESSPIF